MAGQVWVIGGTSSAVDWQVAAAAIAAAIAAGRTLARLARTLNAPAVVVATEGAAAPDASFLKASGRRQGALRGRFRRKAM